MPVLTEGLEQRGILDLSHDARAHADGIEPRVERASQRGVVSGQQQGRAVEGAGEAAAMGARELGDREEAHAGLAQNVGEGADLEVRSDRSVRDHQVERLHRERGQQIVGLITRCTGSPSARTGSSRRCVTSFGTASGLPTARRAGRRVGRPRSVSTSSRPSEKISSASWVLHDSISSIRYRFDILDYSWQHFLFVDESPDGSFLIAAREP